MAEPVTVTTVRPPAPAGPNSRLRMGEVCLAVMHVPTEETDNSNDTSLNQEVDRVN